MKNRLIAVAVVATGIGAIVSITAGAWVGFALGFVGSALNLYAMWLGILIAGAPSPSNSREQFRLLARGLGALTLFPIVFLVMGTCHRLGAKSDRCFIGGVGLVYSFAIGWAVYRTQIPDR